MKFHLPQNITAKTGTMLHPPQTTTTTTSNYMYLDCFIPAHVFLYVLVFVLKDRNVISLYEIIKLA